MSHIRTATIVCCNVTAIHLTASNIYSFISSDTVATLPQQTTTAIT
jgi:hypothetical protein